MSHPDAPGAQMLVIPDPEKRVGRGFIVLFGLLNFGLYLTVMMPALFSLPYKVGILAPDNKAGLLGVVATLGAIVLLIAGPIAGVMSDRTRTRIGRRRPWLIGGIVVLAAGSAIVGLSASIPVLLVGWIIVSLGNAATAAAVSPIVAERVPVSQRGLMGAIVGVATQVSGVLGYVIGGVLTQNVLLMFIVPVIVLAVFGAIYMIFVMEPEIDLPTTTIAQTFRLFVFDPRKHPDFSFVWLGKLCMQTALAFLTTYQLYFLLDRLGFTAEEAGSQLALVGGLGVLVTMTFAIVSGTISDRIKRRKPFVYAASALTSAGLVMMAFAEGFGLFFAAVMCILGAAGMFGAADVAMASDLVPDREQAGRWMSIYNLSATLSTAIAPVLGAALLLIGPTAGGNYTALFLTGAVLALGVGITTRFIKGIR